MDAAGEARRNQVDRRRAEQAVDDARFRLMNVNPANRLVAEEYESALEEAKRNLQRHEAGAAAEPSEVEKFTEANWQELLSLSQDLGALWGAPTTTDRDRKQVIRTVVQTVIVKKRTREMIRARIVWVDGEADTVVEIKLAPYAHRMMAQLDARGLTPAEITRELNALGLVTTQGNSWSVPTVAQAVRGMRKRDRERYLAACG